MKLKDFQDRFQRAILDRDDAILSDIPDGPHETKTNLLGIYRDAYVLRLIDVVGGDYELLRRYLGEEQCADMARAYIASHPSQHRSVRWFAHRLPEFLSATAPYSQRPVLSELAGLERALNDAFDGSDAPVLRMDDLAAIPAELWAQLVFVRHPTASRLDVKTNAGAIWAALKAAAEPPPPASAEDGGRLLVWRQDSTSMFRALAAEEAMMWDEMSKGKRFGDLCEMLAAYDDPPSASARAAGFLKTWLDAGSLSKVVRPR